MTVAVIDYGAGNLRSAAKALAFAARTTGEDVIVTADPHAIARADRVVLPGVGAFAECKRGLEAVPGVVAAMSEAVIVKGRPFLGICVGMQLMATVGVEYGEHPGLDWIKGRVVKLTPNDPTLKIPQMGWNDLNLRRPDHPIFAGLKSGAHGYFVHSYHYLLDRAEDLLADVDYGGPVAAAIGRDNLVGLQFHPEKSQAVGLALLGNFLRWKP
ncbi:imidazole glycerol phosphate synthase subunit HisH [Dongia mobilis]|jgi:glutamine amidotransferase|uniref:imidazole glycerol phosphate synthase subunit HisH n=1 Tax=Dongia sp. TaxID=1977262 RepID=UPI0026F2CE66